MIRSTIIVLFLILSLSNTFAQGSVVLVGGGSENYNDWSDAPYRWLVTHAANRKIAVLHYADTSTFFTAYLPWLSPCSVSNLAITSVAQANDSATYRFILQHDGIFLRGGDQALYVANWRGTLAQQAIKEVYQRGGVVGGTSAGEMVLSEVSFTGGSTNPWTILRTPMTSITLVDSFLGLLPNTLAESHTNERGRIGRLPVFLARYKASTGRSITGIAVDVNTALTIDSAGVGEVMGGSAVTLLRWNSLTQYALEAGKPFSLSNMSFDQLLPGWKIHLQSGSITVPPSAIAFHPKPIVFPAGNVILDGSGNSSDWIAVAGSLRTLQQFLPLSTDTVGIVSSPANPSSANTVNATLSSWGIPSRVLLVDEARKNNSDIAAALASAKAFVFVGNSIDSLARFFAGTTTVGTTFTTRVDAGITMLFLSEDVMLAGEQAIGGIYSSVYNAYYGALVQVPGLNVLKGIQLVPRFYQNSNNASGYDYSENRSMGMHWSMGLSQLPYGLLIDAGTHVVVAQDSIVVRGTSSTTTPAILIDARNATWTDFPQFHRPGKPEAVRNAAIVGARLHILRPGDGVQVTTVEEPQPSMPEGFRLEQNYPNPFNPATVIRYRSLATGKTDLRVYDVLGREIVTLVNAVQRPGSYRVTFDGSNIPSGTYIYRMAADGDVLSKKMILIK